MNTPICDFVRSYAQKGALRLHMPGHKGEGHLGLEGLDITEIDGADSLYEAAGIIRQSEENAGRIFGAHSFYSTEGSSQCIRAMLYLAMLWAKEQGRRPLIAAARNVHKTFLSGAALLDLDVMWLEQKGDGSYLSCRLEAQEVDAALTAAEEKPTAVYITSPDYLGSIADVAAIAKVCRRHGALLLVDNAHGAYLRFLSPSMHPMDLGADICCDSAHKTLPVVTGGAYLHLSKSAPEKLVGQAKNALALFGSTSPSYLILQSLDGVNPILAGEFPRQLEDFVPRLTALKERLEKRGFTLWGDEPLKLTLVTKPCGYEGAELAGLLAERGVVCEFADPDFAVMMFTPQTGQQGIDRLEAALNDIPRREAVTAAPPAFSPCQRVLSIREAMLAPQELLPVEQCAGRILAAASVGCPPAVPIVICGQRIDERAAECFRYYGVTHCAVVTE